MFHVVYSRHYYDLEQGYGDFANSWTVLRNVPYSKLSEFTKDKLAEKKVECDAYYKIHEENKMTDNMSKYYKDQCFASECFIVDDEDYFKTYQDVYGYHVGGMKPEEDYIHDYGQKHSFMLQKDYERRA